MGGNIVTRPSFVLMRLSNHIRFRKRHKKVSICGSKTSQIYHLVKKLILLHQGIVSSLFLYIDVHVEMFRDMPFDASFINVTLELSTWQCHL